MFTVRETTSDKLETIAKVSPQLLIVRDTGGATVNIGSFTPVRTDRGIAYMQYDVPEPYYADITQVISGVVLTEDYEKTSDNVLRIIYSYTIT